MQKAVLDYDLLESINENKKTILYQAIRHSTQEHVLIKLLKDEAASTQNIRFLEREYEILKNLHISGVLKASDLEKSPEGFILILEGFQGATLAHYLKDNALDWLNFLKIAIALSEIVELIHEHNIIIKNISPQSILIDPVQFDVKLYDLGAATISSRENPEILLPNVFTGDFEYISPEQSGRMNRDVDFRTDIYSLGLVFFQMLTRTFPFIYSDYLELIHCHIAKIPPSPSQVNPAVPLAISNIVMKCLAKAPEDRYQRAYGLTNDLQECLTQLQEKSTISHFALGLKDDFATFRIPRQLYGREAEINILLGAFRRVCKGDSEGLFISGYAGIGKTFLVQEVQKPIIEKRGFFISGKFDQLQRDIPYSALIQSFKELVHQLLKEEERILFNLRKKLLTQLKGNAQVMIEIIPEIEWIIGKQSPVPELNPGDSQIRLGTVFQNFIQALATKEHPLVIFLDDLHWADSASLDLIKALMTETELRYLLVIGAFREQGVSTAHPLSMALEQIRDSGGIIHTLALAPLHKEIVQQFTADVLHCTRDEVSLLSELLYQKTRGNPFFLNQLLQNLHKQNKIWFDLPSGRWKWNLEEIQKLEFSENVIDLLTKKIRQLPLFNHEVLSYAAAIGNRFPLQLLSLALQVPVKTLFQQLLQAVQEELIRPVGEEYKLAELTGADLKAMLSMNIMFEFVHDRIQQAAYAFLSNEEKYRIHYKIGKLLLEKSGEEQLEENIFEIISHLNQAILLIDLSEEKLELAKLNLRACKKAKSSAAFATAYACVNTAKRLLDKNSWQEDYNFTYTIYLELAESSYLAKQFDHIDHLSKVILDNAKTNIDKGNLYILKINYYTNISKTQQAIEDGLECLKLFGIHLTKHPNTVRVLFEIFWVKWKLRDKTIGELANLPTLTDPEKLFLLKLLIRISPPAFISNKNLLCVMTCMLMRLTLDHGNSDSAFFIYCSYAGVLEVAFRDYQTAFEFGKLSLNMAEKFPSPSYKCRANYVMAMIINHWTHHLKTNEEYMHNCYVQGVESGELLFIAFIGGFYGFLDGTYGWSVQEAYEKLNKYKDVVYSTKNKQALNAFILKRQLLLALKRPDFDGLSLSDEEFNESEYVKQIRNQKEMAAAFQAYCAYKSQALYLFGHYEEALKLFEESIPGREAAVTLVTEREIYFYQFLVISAVYLDAPLMKRLKYWWQMKKIQRLFKLWKKNCPDNNAHRFAIIGAELARLQGKIDQALILYNQAIKLAKEYRYIREEALGNELAAKLCLEHGKVSNAQHYMNEAYYSYYKWGGAAKVKQLELLYPGLLRKQISDSLISKNPSHALESLKNKSFDNLAIMQAAAALSAEMQLENLLDKLMKIVVEIAGADKAIFIMEDKGKWTVQAIKAIDQQEIRIRPLLNEQQQMDLYSFAVVQYVARSKESLVLNDALHVGMFTRDTYLIEKRPKSVLVIPLLHQSQLVGILYLENHLLTESFTVDCVEVLRLLSSQIAISIDNAVLYSNLEVVKEHLQSTNVKLEDYNRNLEQKVSLRTLQLKEKNEQLEETLNRLKLVQTQIIQQEKLAALGSLTEGVAHEIKNPLNFINNFSTLSLKLLNQLSSGLPGDQSTSEKTQNLMNSLKSNLEKIVAHGKRADSIVTDMMHHSPVTQIPREAIDLNQCIKEYVNLILEKYSQKSPETKIQVDSHYDDAIKSVEVIPQDIGRVFVNILDNACQALNQKRESQPDFTPHLVISTKQLEHSIEIIIRDNGLGIPKTHLDKIFMPFFTTKAQGTGLGLSIAYNIVVHEHKGEIRVNTEEGQFTEFCILLPRS